jgi:hypothetical protein
MPSSMGGSVGGPRRALFGGAPGRHQFVGAYGFARRARRAGSAGRNTRFAPRFDPLEARTLLTLPPTLQALALAAESPSIRATETGTPPDDESNGSAKPQPVSGAFLVDGAEDTASLTFDKVVQGDADTCAFDAILSAVALSSFNLDSAISVLSQNSPTEVTYDVRLHEPITGGGTEPVEVPVEYNGTIQPGDARSTDDNEFWPTLFQRAYLSLESSIGQDYHAANNAFQALTGLSATDLAMANVTPSVISGWLDGGNPVVAFTESSGDPYTLDPSQGIIGDHGYTVVGIGSSGGTTYVTLRNPWGNDSTSASGSSSVNITDGIFRIPWATFTQYYTDAVSDPISGPSINHPEAALPAFKNAAPAPLTVYIGQTVTVDCSAVDSDGDSVSYALTDGPPAALGANGLFTWTAGFNDLSANVFTVMAKTSAWTVASESFSINVVPPDPTVGRVVVSPGTITNAGTDALTLQATGIEAPAGTVVNVDFTVSVDDQTGEGQTQAYVGNATAATNWTWTGYLGGLAPGTYTVSAVATSSDFYESAPAVATLTVTQAPDYNPPINRAISQVQVSPAGSNSAYYGLGTTMDGLGHIRAFYETNTSSPAAYMNEYTADGLPLLAAPVQLPVNGAVVGRDDGSFEIVFISSGSIKVQKFSAAGTAVGNPIVAASGITFGTYSGLEAAADDAGNLLIAYSDGSGNLDALTLSASGTVTRAPWRVYSNASDYPRVSSVALDDAGAGAIVWVVGQTLMACRVTNAGLENAASDLTVSEDSTSFGQAGVDDDGNITIVYSAGGNDSAGSTILMRRYGGNGTSDSGEQVVEAIANDDLGDARVAVNSEGWAAVAWDDDQDGADTLTFCKLIDPEGKIQTSDVEVPSNVSDNTTVTDVAINDEGRFCVEFDQSNSPSPGTSVNIGCLWADLTPVFGGPYQFTVPLGSPSGTFVGVVQALDPDGEQTSYSLLDSGAFAIDATTGEITVAGASALQSTAETSYTLSVEANDGYALSNVRPVTNVVIMVDDPTPPKISAMPNWTIDAGETVVPVIEATDPTGCLLTYSAAVGNHASATVTVSGDDLLVTPAAGYTGSFPVAVTATNGLASTTATFQVNVVKPTLASVPDLTIHGLASLKLGGSDSSGTALTYSAAIAGGGAGAVPATLSIVNNALSITPRPGYAGTFTVTTSANDGPDTASQSFNVTVVPAKTPTITWANPADVLTGTPLTALQLDATASVPGTFSYTPAAGTILGVGANQLLTVTFTPTDLTDYTAVTDTVPINVRPSPPNVTNIVGAGKKKTGLTGFTVIFDEALNAQVADDQALFDVLGAVTKHHKTVYTKPVRIRQISFDGQTRVTIKLAKPYKGAVQVKVLPGIPAADGASSAIGFSAIID